MQAFSSISLRGLPHHLDLTNRLVHVWQSTLDLPTEYIENFARSLSSDESARAKRFRFEHLQRRFIASRGILRVILASYLDADPAQLQFAYGPQGKPTLAASNHTQFAQAQPNLSFNLSHSESLALYAVTLDRQVGIDLEYIPPSREVNELAKRFFSPQEYSTICALPPEQQKAAFLQIWTHKEAYLKATGEGLMGLKQVEVNLPQGNKNIPPRLSILNDPQASLRWKTVQLHPHPDYVAALAIEGGDWQLVQYGLICET
ncbi:4'-phosphopantetheinyl transferase [filamentous cyanobacterium CCP2]|nr:4'-phosphopantetheinyl transferase [filamentous cyanobacterium CCP2]